MGKSSRLKLGEYYSNHTPVERAVVSGDPFDIKTWGGDAALTRAYRPRHPNQRFLPLRFPGRGVELGTEKQYYLWRKIARVVDDLPAHTPWRITLQKLADSVGLSRSQVSRFLRKLDWWRAIDVCAIRGRNGGVYIWKAPTVAAEKDSYGNGYIPPDKLARSRWQILRHRVWQSRFDRWRERYEEVREIARYTRQAIDDLATPITTFAKMRAPRGAY